MLDFLDVCNHRLYLNVLYVVFNWFYILYFRQWSIYFWLKVKEFWIRSKVKQQSLWLNSGRTSLSSNESQNLVQFILIYFSKIVKEAILVM